MTDPLKPKLQELANRLHRRLSAEYAIHSGPVPPCYVENQRDFHTGIDAGIATAQRIVDEELGSYD